MEVWMKNAVIEGFQRLTCLGLEGQPAADVLPMTVATWCEALSLGRVWVQARDEPRFRVAFARLCASSRRWPSVPDFVAALPAVEQKALPRPKGDPEHARRALEELARILRA
ncbi:hypothetical protein CO610_07375 [Lysobacteraceae bacterium NML95-0200]|nr:hypothetical protein CO610_07375 [Xanthomonadaceae bacterium NML95-0200]